MQKDTISFNICAISNKVYYLSKNILICQIPTKNNHTLTNLLWSNFVQHLRRYMPELLKEMLNQTRSMPELLKEMLSMFGMKLRHLSSR